MELSRTFTQEVSGKAIDFEVTYNPQTHFFTVVEDGDTTYILSFSPSTKSWKTTDGPEPSIPVDELANLVQHSFGVFV